MLLKKIYFNVNFIFLLFLKEKNRLNYICTWNKQSIIHHCNIFYYMMHDITWQSLQKLHSPYLLEKVSSTPLFWCLSIYEAFCWCLLNSWCIISLFVIVFKPCRGRNSQPPELYLLALRGQLANYSATLLSMSKGTTWVDRNILFKTTSGYILM